MECPKCGHEQADTVECEACGIIFEKFARIQKATEEQDHSYVHQQTNTFDLSFLDARIVYRLVIFAVVGAVIFMPLYMMLKKQKNSKNEQVYFIKKSGPVEVKELKGIAKQLHDSHPPQNRIEMARNATVFIETSFRQMPL